jgi:PIN like domain
VTNGHHQRIFVDANLIGVARALEQTHDQVVYPGHSDWPFDQDEDDDVWLSYVGDNDWLAIARDKRIRYRTIEKQALVSHRVRVVVVSTVENLRIAEMTQLIEANWTGIEQLLEVPPAFYHLTKSGISKRFDYDD